MTDRRATAGGFTLVELAVVTALVVPLILVVTSATQAVSGTFAANENASIESEVAARAIADVDRVLRGGRRHTLRVVANEADVAAGRATAVGEWSPMPPADPRPTLQVWTTTGEVDLELVVPSRPNELRFVPDPADPADGVDNDGDRLVDEGRLVWARGGLETLVADHLEHCSFRLEGNTIRVALRIASPGHGAALRRTTVEHTVRLNNP